MPKKHHHQHHHQPAYAKPSPSAHPSFSTSNRFLEPTASSQDGSSSSSNTTVNDLIAHLRHTQLQGTPAQRASAALATNTTTTSRAVPPSLRHILQIPDTPPPRPRPGMHPAAGTRTRRVPGPPPPRSWLLTSQHAPKLKEGEGIGESASRKVVHRLARLPGIEVPREGSLLHCTLREMAENWRWHVEYDHFYLSVLPTKVKELILSYVATFGEEGCGEGLRVLFAEEDEAEGAAGNEDLKRMDLGNQIGKGVGLKWLKRYLSTSGKSPEGGLSFEGALRATTGKWLEGMPPSTPPPSWEDDAEAVGASSPTPLPKTIFSPRFTTLTHLSLAHPDSTTTTWPALLSLTISLSTLTHLSLAYWPFPTLTPNSLTSKMIPKISQGAHQSSNSGIEYGGTNIYSRQENDLAEAASILKRLANATYCLKWLDLEGCGEWWAALRWEEMDTDDGDITDFTSSSQPRFLGPDFNAAWRSLEWLGLGVGWLPGNYEESGCSTLCHQRGNCVPSSHFSSKEDTPMDAISNHSRPYASWLGVRDKSENMEEKLKVYRRQKEVEDFLALERVGRGVADWVRRKRKEGGGKWVAVDLRRPDGMGSAYAKVGDL